MILRPDGIRGTTITGTGMYVPERVLTNHDLEKLVETTDEWIVERTGIRERRIAAPEQASSDLALIACQRALEMANVEAANVDQIVLATTTPDRILPSCACTLQRKLGATKAAAYDMFAACTGFIYGLGLARGLIGARVADTVLVIGVDMHSDGELGEVLEVPAGISANPASDHTVAAHEHYIRMQGKKLFPFAVRSMEDSTRRCAEAAGWSPGDIDLFIPHQANLRIIEGVRERLGLPADKVYVNIERYGNTSSASIPIALDECVRAGRLKPGDKLAMAAFGGGATWGASAMT